MITLQGLTVRHFRVLKKVLETLKKNTQILIQCAFVQHGSTSIFEHTVFVAIMSLRIAHFFGITVDEKSLLRGALLHDYFLYDWHDKSARPALHGFFHPSIALQNALCECNLNPIERDIIKHHMFPLTICPPHFREAFIVCLADKICSLYETFRLNERKKSTVIKINRVFCAESKSSFSNKIKKN